MGRKLISGQSEIVGKEKEKKKCLGSHEVAASSDCSGIVGKEKKKFLDYQTLLKIGNDNEVCGDLAVSLNHIKLKDERVMEDILDKSTSVKVKADWSIEPNTEPINPSYGKVSLDLRKREVLPPKVTNMDSPPIDPSKEKLGLDSSYVKKDKPLTSGRDNVEDINESPPSTVKKRNGRSSCLSVKGNGMKTRYSKFNYKVSWSLEEEISKVVEVGVALGFDFNGKKVGIIDIFAEAKNKLKARGRK
ncbi:hypothetical protein LWI29_029619 [Acer saccharum]|uniref:Uncharacterized protein n=1 Tax=Acer saccharum TaxID=4024 RepID=A0AA39SYI5_ACESA|nr:hypothetical protein LWI29_029619 [Acer saccharum]